MRLALISDIHGNLCALDAVLSELKKSSIENVVCLGDVAATGPHPRETLQRLKSANVRVVMGNKDQLLLGEIEPKKSAQDEEMQKINEIDSWCASQLTLEEKEFMKGFAKTVFVPLSREDSLLCFHGSPNSNVDLITSKTPDDVLRKMLSGARAKIMAGGHSHVQMLRHYGSTMLINPGSVGQAIQRVPGSNEVRHLPWAEYAIVESDGDGFPLRVEFFRKRYDLSKLISTAMESGMPHSRWWATRGELGISDYA